MIRHEKSRIFGYEKDVLYTMYAFSHTTARIFTNSRFVENKDTVRRHFLRKRKEKKENEIMCEREREREKER